MEARPLCQMLGDPWGAALAQTSLGFVAYLRGDYNRAAAQLDVGLALARASHDAVTAARAVTNLGTVALARGELRTRAGALRGGADAAGASSGAMARWPCHCCFSARWRTSRVTASRHRAAGGERGSGAPVRVRTRGRFRPSFCLARVVRSLGQHARAMALFQESLAIRREQGDRRGIAECFEALAMVADAQRKPAVAACLLGAADTLRAAIGAPSHHAGSPPASSSWPGCGGASARVRRPACRRRRDAARRGRALRSGRWCGSGASAAPARSRSQAHPPHPLIGRLTRARRTASPRECEVTALVARGMSNRDIAAALVVAEGSAANYVKRILTKLGFRSRAQIAVWAARHALADPPDA